MSLILDLRELDHPDDDLLIGHSDAHALGQAGVGDEALDVPAQLLGIRDFAVAQQTRGKVEARAAGDSAVVDLRGGDVAPVDVETDGAAF